MKLLIDTNVIMDFLEGRSGAESAKELFKLAENHSQYECVTSSSVTDILYLLTKAMIKENQEKDNVNRKTRKEIEELARDYLFEFLSILHILNVSEQNIKSAFLLKWHDTEDALQYVVAKENNVDTIITNNKSDYESADIAIMTAQEFLDSIKLRQV